MFLRLLAPLCLLLALVSFSYAGDRELVIAIRSSPPHLNPLLLSGQVVGSVGAQLFAGLTRLDADGTPQPYLATGWTESADHLSFTFRLRENATFHDGVPVTARDVAYSLYACRRYHPFRPLLEALREVETPDEHTVVLRLSRPFPALPKVLIPSLAPILPRHVYDTGQPLPGHPANSAPVGSGPFMLESFVPNREIRLKRHTAFFLPGEPLLDRITYRIYWDQSETASALAYGGIDVLPLASPFFIHDFRRNHPDVAVAFLETPNLNLYMALEYNLRKKPLSDLRVREAVALAVNRARLAEESGLRPQYGPIPPGAPFFSPLSLPYDPERANRLLDEAGYPRRADGKRFSLTVDYIPGEDFFPAVVQMLRLDLERVGIDVRAVDSPNFTQWMRHIATGRYQAALDGLFAWHDPVVGVHRLYSGRHAERNVIWSNAEGYENPEVEDLMKAASSEADPIRRQTLYDRFQRVVAQDHPMLWLMAIPSCTLHSKNVLHLEDLGLGILSPLDGVDKRSPLP